MIAFTERKKNLVVKSLHPSLRSESRTNEHDGLREKQHRAVNESQNTLCLEVKHKGFSPAFSHCSSGMLSGGKGDEDGPENMSRPSAHNARVTLPERMTTAVAVPTILGHAIEIPNYNNNNNVF